MVFFVQDTGPCRHPLYIAGIDDTAVTRAVVVRNAAFIGDGHRFEALVRMDAYATDTIGGPEVDLGVEVQHQEGAEPLLRDTVVPAMTGDIIIHPETVAYHAGGSGLGDDTFDLLVHKLFSVLMTQS